MQLAVVLLSGAALLGGAGLLAGDYLKYPSESAPALKLSSLFLTDDSLAVGAFRIGLQQKGYKGAESVLVPALRRDPANSLLWADTGESFLADGDRPRADYCFERAAELAPNDPATLFAAGDYFTRARDQKRAIRYFSRILRSDRGSPTDSLTGNIFVYYDTLRVRQDHLADTAVPTAASARLWLGHFIANNDPAAGREVWTWLHSKGYDDDLTTAAWARYLLSKRLFTAAGEDWASHFAARNDGFPAHNRVFNAGFENEPIRSEFDWTDDGFNKVTATRDDAIHHEGRYSERIDFRGDDNPDYHHFGQDVYLTPGRYRLTGYLRTAAITSAEGVHLRISGFGSSVVIAETEGLSGTNEWTAVSVPFETTAAAPVVRVELARHRSLRIDNQLTGRVWIDSVSIAPLP